MQKIRQFLAINRKFADSKNWGNEAIDPMTQVIWKEFFDVREWKLYLGFSLSLGAYIYEYNQEIQYLFSCKTFSRNIKDNR